jgi:hypothetical protein
MSGAQVNVRYVPIADMSPSAISIAFYRRTWSQQLSGGQSSGSTLMMEAP